MAANSGRSIQRLHSRPLPQDIPQGLNFMLTHSVNVENGICFRKVCPDIMEVNAAEKTEDMNI